MCPAFDLQSEFSPAGDQEQAIAALIQGVEAGKRNQVLLGVTGSGKTFTMAHLIARTQRPALILAPNKTLAAQLYGEMKSFFPNNAVEYFVSYYDYYQPEAYVARSDTYIEKEATINEQIDLMRHAATRALLERNDVIIVASISCIYNLGSVETYSAMVREVKVGEILDVERFLMSLVDLQYKRNDFGFVRGTFRVRGDVLDIFPSHLEDRAWRLSLFGDEVESIFEVDALTGERLHKLESIRIFPNSHHVTPKPSLQQSLGVIKEDLKERVAFFEAQGKLVEAQRLQQRTLLDLETLATTGSCPGIENYSRYFDGRKPGDAPYTLLSFLPQNALFFMDESHIALPQLHGMYRGDVVRKTNLSEHGFRLPSCLDNRPLKFEEWDAIRPQTIFVSATPASWELEQVHNKVVEQIIRPTGLMDPVCYIRPVETQVDDLIHECQKVVKEGGRVLVTTLTKKMAEALTEYLTDIGIKVRYIHSDVETLERIEIIHGLRKGTYDVLVGINLLREGLDIPECRLVAILDADKEGYLRSKTSLIQTIGRAARNVDGYVILYADHMTKALSEALEETNRRRERQREYNLAHGITPESIKKSLNNILESVFEKDYVQLDDSPRLSEKEFKKTIQKLEKQMFLAAENLEFEEAARLRDQIKTLEHTQLGLQ